MFSLGNIDPIDNTWFVNDSRSDGLFPDLDFASMQSLSRAAVIDLKNTDPYKRRTSALRAVIYAVALTVSASEPAASADSPQTRRLRDMQQNERIWSELAVHKQSLHLLKLEDPANLRKELEDSTGYTDLGEGKEKEEARESMSRRIDAYCEHYQIELETVGLSLDHVAAQYMNVVHDWVVNDESSGSDKGVSVPKEPKGSLGSPSQ